MKALVAVKRVVDYNVKIELKMMGLVLKKTMLKCLSIHLMK